LSIAFLLDEDEKTTPGTFSLASRPGPCRRLPQTCSRLERAALLGYAQSLGRPAGACLQRIALLGGFGSASRELRAALARLNVSTLTNCGGALKIIASIEDPAVIVKILRHLGLPTRAPPRASARRVNLFQTI
jgi:hypothetical protein